MLCCEKNFFTTFPSFKKEKAVFHPLQEEKLLFQQIIKQYLQPQLITHLPEWRRIEALSQIWQQRYPFSR